MSLYSPVSNVTHSSCWASQQAPSLPLTRPGHHRANTTFFAAASSNTTFTTAPTINHLTPLTPPLAPSPPSFILPPAKMTRRRCSEAELLRDSKAETDLHLSPSCLPCSWLHRPPSWSPLLLPAPITVLLLTLSPVDHQRHHHRRSCYCHWCHHCRSHRCHHCRSHDAIVVNFATTCSLPTSSAYCTSEQCTVNCVTTGPLITPPWSRVLSSDPDHFVCRKCCKKVVTIHRFMCHMAESK